MKYAYSRIFDGAGNESWSPSLRVRLIGSRNAIEDLVLVDSGADTTMIAAPLAEFLGVHFHGELEIRGAGSHLKRRARVGTFEIAFGSDRFASPVLVPDEGTLAVLGRNNFFDRYWVAFDNPAREFFIERHAKKRRRSPE